ncbi:universal stress protein [Longispora fulva]|uniref:Nucleotide-binding universal stress UspA family protein n=1 Tax=Longispora fulva TaxID=619741 RepID=A0A8J7KIM2_9ACTN|nr:universal stress protein [Longispora fulva]MBG6134286.1 nucleotide-binding universal stress UspA family protein [Longispora fulva]GIG63000.1 universal stress protein [Longispora fulva]
MSTQPVVTDHVVVGVDGSDLALAAVDWAADAATLRGRPLRIVHASIWPQMRFPDTPVLASRILQGLRVQGEEYVATATTRAQARQPGLAVESEVIEGAPAPVLIRESRTADMIVLGHRGLGGFTGLLVGSVGVQLAAHAGCPVIVVRPHTLPPGPAAGTVVVGVDGSEESDAAIEFAFTEASLNEVGLTAVHAWRWPQSTEPGDMLPLVYDADVLAAEELRMFAESLAGWQERFPDVKVHHDQVRTRAGKALIEASPGAHLLVVGSRGRGGFTGLLLGSVSQAALHHADCPVAVVRS